MIDRDTLGKLTAAALATASELSVTWLKAPMTSVPDDLQAKLPYVYLAPVPGMQATRAMTGGYPIRIMQFNATSVGDSSEMVEPAATRVQETLIGPPHLEIAWDAAPNFAAGRIIDIQLDGGADAAEEEGKDLWTVSETFAFYVPAR